jgi:polysaccharide deacetylase family protein (PEP-CTERM system associated)
MTVEIGKMDTTRKKRTQILTVDLEDWFHICGVADCLPRSQWGRLESRVLENTSILLDLLDRHKARATFFVLGWVAERNPDLVREIARRGHEIASHGYYHQRVYTLSAEAFQRDLLKSLEILSPLSPAPILGFRAPEWSIRDDSLWALEIVRQAGFLYDASMAPLLVIGNQAYPKNIRRIYTSKGMLWEVPPLVGQTPWLNLPVGGGWGLRIFPYSLITHFIRCQQRQYGPAVMFVHPREMDPRSPVAAIPFIKRFVVSAGICSTAQRLQRLFSEFAFTSISDYLLTFMKEKG